MARVKWITVFEGSEERLLFLLSLLLRERNVRAVRREVRVEAAALANSVGPWLLTVDNFSVLFGVLVTSLVLSALVGVLRVAHLVQIRKRLGLDTSLKSWSGLGDRTRRRSQWNVLEF